MDPNNQPGSEIAKVEPRQNDVTYKQRRAAMAEICIQMGCTRQGALVLTERIEKALWAGTLLIGESAGDATRGFEMAQFAFLDQN